MLHSVEVKDYMSASLVHLTPETDVLRAIHLLLENNVSGAPVTDKLGNVVGFLSEKDCLQVAMDAGYHEEWGGNVSEYMTPEVITVDADASILDVARIFRNTSFKSLPVMDDNRLAGQITRSDVLRAFQEIR
ncbi:CBS domain-containing protein [Salinisphaera sp. PC39]|uniref:CBS domain-containing protein n=1 Tax=Salinisphaera sp. PC39 TaxID=1304156 RepID=UPI00334053D7